MKGLDVAVEVQSAGQLSAAPSQSFPLWGSWTSQGQECKGRQAGLTRRDPGTIFLETQAQGRKPVVSTELSLCTRFPEHVELWSLPLALQNRKPGQSQAYDYTRCYDHLRFLRIQDGRRTGTKPGICSRGLGVVRLPPPKARLCAEPDPCLLLGVRQHCSNLVLLLDFEVSLCSSPWEGWKTILALSKCLWYANHIIYHIIYHKKIAYHICSTQIYGLGKWRSQRQPSSSISYPLVSSVCSSFPYNYYFLHLQLLSFLGILYFKI